MAEGLDGRLPGAPKLITRRSVVIGSVFVLASLTSLATLTSGRVRSILDLFSTEPVFAQSAPRGAVVPPAHSTPAEDPEEHRIAEVEEAFENFAQKVLAGLDRHVRSEKMRADIRKIIALFRNNRADGSRNFSCEFDPEMANISSFDGPTRTIYLRDDFDPSDIGALSGLGHELKHVDHDDRMRRTVPEERYRAFFNVRDPRGDGSIIVAVPSHEAEAIALQLEMLNVAMDGELKKEVVKGREPRISVKDPDLKKILVWAAGIYFVDPEAFADTIESRYTQMNGVVLFTPDLVRIN